MYYRIVDSARVLLTDQEVIDAKATGKRFRVRSEKDSDGSNVFLQFTDAEEAARDSEELAAALDALPKVIKEEAVSRLQAVFPALKDLDEMKLEAERWLSITVAARQPTADYQKAIDIYTAAKSAIVMVKTFTTQAEVDAYDVTIDPGWPA